jgi:hypothetical protein
LIAQLLAEFGNIVAHPVTIHDLSRFVCGRPLLRPAIVTKLT